MWQGIKSRDTRNLIASKFLPAITLRMRNKTLGNFFLKCNTEGAPGNLREPSETNEMKFMLRLLSLPHATQSVCGASFWGAYETC